MIRRFSIAAATALLLPPSVRTGAAGCEEVGRQRRPWSDDEARVRHVGGDVDEPRCQSGWAPDRFRSARRHLRHAHCREHYGGEADCQRTGVRDAAASAPMASASRSRATAMACGTSGRWISRERMQQISRERRWFGTVPPGRRTGSTSMLAATSSRSVRWARARCGCISSPPRATAFRSPSGMASRRTRGARCFAGRPLPLLQSRRYAGADLRIQQGSERHHLRNHAARPRHRS